MTNQVERRYYKVGEKVWIKPEKALGVIKELDINPKKKLYKAIVETTRQEGDATIIRTASYDLWELNKDRGKTFKEKHKSKSKNPTILFAKVRESAIIPSKDEENAGYDIYSNFKEDEIVIKQGEVKLIPTGVASSVTDDYALIGRERGSTGTKGMSLRSGVIDSGYRGEIFIPINNTSDKTIVITKSVSAVIETPEEVLYPYTKAIAQLLLVHVPKAKVKEITYEELQTIPSKRGTGALGSSNK